MADLLFEIGVEEIPAGFVAPALRQLEEDLAKVLAEARLSHGEVRAVGTPRRLGVWALEVAPRQSDARTESFGPPVAQAFDAQGAPTAAALGFARSQGVEVSQLSRVQTPKGERLAVQKVEKGKRAEQVLPAILERLTAGIRFKKSMRSAHDDVTFARPVRWLVALYGGKPLSVRYGHVRSGKSTYGHRFLAPKAMALQGTPADYLARLRKAHVIVDPAERRAEIEKQLAAVAKKAGGVVRPDEPLLAQVTNLVEHPTAILGEFEKSNLDLPPEVVISEMRNHQRYFAVLDHQGRLTNRFIAVSGTRVKNPRTARHGYERVLRARLADARFFFEEDRKRTLEERAGDLGRRTYQAKLGTELDRTGRIEQIAVALAEALGLGERREQVARAARLCKADLGTGMVGEFPELQGVMGRNYAAIQGEPEEIALAIEDHYRPIGASEEMPRGDLGALVGLADRLHQLVGILGVGEKATSATDPYGLRRAAIGILRVLVHRGYHLSLSKAVESTIGTLSGLKLAAAPPALEAQVLDFLRGRLRALWSDEVDADLVDAVLAAGFDDLVDARQRLEALAAVRSRPDFVPLAVAFKRVANIREKAGPAGTATVSEELLCEPAEKALAAEVLRVEAEVRALRAQRDYPGILKAVAGLKPAVDRFFDEVMVMAEDPPLRANRLAIMKRVSDLFADLADFRKIQAELPPAAA
jgi:glycyl-tRNA synthetase beta chain